MDRYSITEIIQYYMEIIMPDFIWQWEKGSKKFFTKKIVVVKKAVREGCVVKCINTPPRILNHENYDERKKK